jgi:CRISPR-associated endonuclease/helicase Cas3
MGSGKTEAALAAVYELIEAGKADGLYFALPTQVTSNRIHRRIQPFVDRICIGPEPVRLAHSASWMVDAGPSVHIRPTTQADDEAQEHVRVGHSWFASAKRALLAPFGVGTIDQALLGIVAAKHFFVRQFGLAGKVVVLDEVHTYDLYTGTLIDALVRRLRELQCTVIVLSATLIESRRRELLGLATGQKVNKKYPLVSGVASSFIERPCKPPASRKIYIRKNQGSTPIEAALDQASRGVCVLWIRNTVEEAQETFRALRSSRVQGGPSIALLHSRFPFFRREQLEEEWMGRLGKDSANRPAGCVLVSTQVAEQSVDIDADLLITDLAPTDMLLQRIGRLWRHDRERRPCLRPEVWIQMPARRKTWWRKAEMKDLREALGKSARVYSPYVLLRSLEQWQDRVAIEVPDGIRSILEATYADRASADPPAWRELREQLEKQKEKMANQALTATSLWGNPALPDEEGVQTRYSNYPTVQMLLMADATRHSSGTVQMRLLDGKVATACGRDWNFDTAKAIYRNMARVPRWVVSGDAAIPPRWLSNYVLNSAAAGIVQTDGSVHWVGSTEQSGMSYEAEQGIIIDRVRVPRSFDESSDECCG